MAHLEYPIYGLTGPVTSRSTFVHQGAAAASVGMLGDGIKPLNQLTSLNAGTALSTDSSTQSGSVTRNLKRVGYSSISLKVQVPSVPAVDENVVVAAKTADERIIPYSIVDVPVSLWYPSQSSLETISKPVTYPYTISVPKIARLIAGWRQIPSFLARSFELEPICLSNKISNEPVMELVREDVISSSGVLPGSAPVLLLAHGYLGSRFDLCHLAEEMARFGFICISPEYPESLSATYEPLPMLDRDLITETVLSELTNRMGVSPTSFGVVGHSLGCGTAMTIGDSTWARVCIAGPPALRGSPSPTAIKNANESAILCVASINDGAVTFDRVKPLIPNDFVRIVAEEHKIEDTPLPRRAAVLFQNPSTAPNHISFLSEGVNNAMIETLSPLLVLAKALSLPVLDFDKYKDSRDSFQTAQNVVPLVRNFLLQNMIIK